MTEETKGGISRRTLAKGMAWSVPAVAVASAVPAYAASPVVPPEPGISFGSACGNTGATRKGCGGDKTLQVPLTLTNETGADYVFQITSMYTCNCGTAPTGAGSGVVAGVRGIWATPGHASTYHANCSAVTASNCSGGVTNGSIVVPNGTVGKTYWIESLSLSASSSFSTTINWRLLAADCTVLRSGTAQTASAIEPQNCNG